MVEISRVALFKQLNSLFYKSLEDATSFCRLRGNPYVELVHVLYQLLQNPPNDLSLLLKATGIDEAVLLPDILRYLQKLPKGASAVSDFSVHIDESLEQAFLYTQLFFKEKQIRTGYWLIALLKTPQLKNMLLGVSLLFKEIDLERLLQNFHEITLSSPEAKDVERAAVQVEAQSSLVRSSDAKTESALERYTVDLTQRAAQGLIDPVVGREQEIRQLLAIIMRRRQNNPLLVGEAGVGKTAVVEGLALKISAKEVPASLQKVRIHMLDVGLLQAGAGVKGEFEKRLLELIEEVQNSLIPILLFIDEAHMLIGAGGAPGVGDAANLLKPALARGDLRTIAATTWSEYKKYIEKDAALSRRFQVIHVLEPKEEAALRMLRALYQPLAKHHQVAILEEALVAAVKLAERYIPTRQLPDKAISLLDTACAKVALSQQAYPQELENHENSLASLELALELVTQEKPLGENAKLEHAAKVRELLAKIQVLTSEVLALKDKWQQEKALVSKILELQRELSDLAFAQESVNDLEVSLQALQAELKTLQGETPLVYVHVDELIVAEVVAEWTGIPLRRLYKSELASIQQLAAKLNQRLIGQTQASEILSKQIQIAKANLDNPQKPLGVFLLCGPSGVGKTETALALADILYGGERNLIVINMSEFQEAHTISTLKGSPPGYVGYGEGGVLTEAVRKKPYSIILLDEIEKAHPDVYEIFYQVFDKGYMEDAEGRFIDFSNTIILLTSNVGSEAFSLERGVQQEAWQRELKRTFPVAFLNRLTLIPYYPLSKKSLREIAKLHLMRIRERIVNNHGLEFTYTEEVLNYLAEEATKGTMGGRMVEFVLNNTLLAPLSELLLSSMEQDRLTEIKEIKVVKTAAEQLNPFSFHEVLKEGSHE